LACRTDCSEKAASPRAEPGIVRSRDPVQGHQPVANTWHHRRCARGKRGTADRSGCSQGSCVARAVDLASFIVRLWPACRSTHSTRGCACGHTMR
jgi:hypothetical protein